MQVTGFTQPLWAITIALKNGLEDHLSAMQRLLSKFSVGFAVLENHSSGHLHLHAMVFRQVQRANKVTVLIERFLTSNDIEFGRYSIDVKRCKVPEGWLFYLKKNMKGTDFFWVAGYTPTWLHTYKTELKLIPRKLLNSNFQVTTTTFQTLVLQYAKQNGCLIETKRCVMDVCKSMMRNGYEFGSIFHKLHGLTSCLLVSIGSEDARFEIELAFGVSTFVG